MLLILIRKESQINKFAFEGKTQIMNNEDQME